MDNLFDLSGKVAIVTGAGRGLGKAMAKGLAKAGADIVAADVLDTEDTVKEVKGTGRKAFGINVNVLSEADIKNMVIKTTGTFGKVDILVNNAGIFRTSGAEDMKTDDWDAVMDINLKGQFLCAREVAPHMIRQRAGKIINISSVAGICSFPGSAAYNSSKAGLILLTKTLAAEWGRYNIQVNAICPGLFETEMTRDFTQDNSFMQTIRDRVPLSRAGVPEELAGTAVYLASKASDYLTGHALVVDGGWTARL